MGFCELRGGNGSAEVKEGKRGERSLCVNPG